MYADAIPPSDVDLAAFRSALAGAASGPDEALAELLTTGYGHVLELEAEQLATARRVDRLLQHGDDAAVVAATHQQRARSSLLAALRAELEAAAATRRLRRAGAPRPLGP